MHPDRVTRKHLNPMGYMSVHELWARQLVLVSYIPHVGYRLYDVHVHMWTDKNLLLVAG